MADTKSVADPKKRITRKQVVGIVFLGLLIVLIAGICFWRIPRTPPSAEQGVAIFVAPHPDDETYGMSQSIAENVKRGVDVTVILVTDGESSGTVPSWIAGPDARDLDGDGDIDKWDFGLARREEFRNATRALGVENVVFCGAAASQGASGFEDEHVADGDVGTGESLEQYLEAKFATIAGPNPIGLLMTVAPYGNSEYSTSLKRALHIYDAKDHPDHTATADAILSIPQPTIEKLYFSKIYVNYLNPYRRLCAYYARGDVTSAEAEDKALDAYSARGKASTPLIWESARENHIDYLVPGDWYR